MELWLQNKTGNKSGNKNTTWMRLHRLHVTEDGESVLALIFVLITQ